MLVFAGSVWDDTASSWDSTAYNGNPYAMWKSLFTDLFRSGEDSKKVDVEGLRYILLIAAGEPDTSNPLSTTTPATSPSNRPDIHLRWYALTTFKSSNSSKLPRIEVTPLGPRYSFRLNRFKEPDPSLWTEAMKKPAGQESKDGRGKKKNIGVDSVGDKIGRVHLGRQDLSELQTRKMRGLKRGVGENEDEAIGGELELDDIEAEDDGRSERKKAKL
jgi:ribosome production factor 2